MDARCQFQQPNHTPIGPINRDERARVEDYWPRTLRAHAVSSSVAGPISARMSARTSARLSRCARSVIAAATQALTDGARPAATAASAAWTAASSTVTVSVFAYFEHISTTIRMHGIWSIPQADHSTVTPSACSSQLFTFSAWTRGTNRHRACAAGRPAGWYADEAGGSRSRPDGRRSTPGAD